MGAQDVLHRDINSSMYPPSPGARFASYNAWIFPLSVEKEFFNRIGPKAVSLDRSSRALMRAGKVTKKLRQSRKSLMELRPYETKSGKSRSPCDVCLVTFTVPRFKSFARGAL